MKFSKTPGELVAEVKMERAGYFRGALMIVEALTDKKLWASLVDTSSCRILLSYGKSGAIKVLQLLSDARDDFGVLVVVDDDLDSILGRRLSHQSIVYTDAHDLEAVLIRSGALDRVLAEFVDPEAIVRWEEEAQTHVRESVLASAEPIGRVRLAVQRDQLDVSFANLTCFTLYDSETRLVSLDKLTEFITRQNGAISTTYVGNVVSHAYSDDPWHICHGNDLLTILCILMRDRFRVRNIGPDSLFSHLRVGFTRFDLEQTHMFSQLREWESRTGVVVLSQA